MIRQPRRHIALRDHVHERLQAYAKARGVSMAHVIEHEVIPSLPPVPPKPGAPK